MTESEAISIIETEILKTIPSFKTNIVSRDFHSFSEYTATIAIILKEDVLTKQTLLDLYTKLKNDSITEIEISNTSINLNDLDFEVLTLSANITIGE